MKSAFLVSAGKFEIREIPVPTCPDDGILLTVHACGVCGSDLRRWKEGPGDEPVVPGHEVSGVVAAVGKNVLNYTVGDRLAIAPDIHCGRCYYCQHGMYNLCDNLKLVGITPGYPGGFAEFMVLTGEMLQNGIVHPMPEGMSFLDAALAEPCSSVLAAHDKAETDLAHTVLVMGGGPIGCLHIAVAHARGARVILSEPSAVRREIAKPFFPEAVIDPMTEDVVSAIHQLTAGLGVDIVICANPVAATQTQAVEVVRKGGRIIFFGGLPKANPMTSLDANRIHYGEIQVVGAFSYHPVYHRMALDVIARGLIPSQKIITHEFNLDQINQAFETSASGESLKVMVTF